MAGGGARLAREGGVRGGPAVLAFERAGDRARAGARGGVAAAPAGASGVFRAAPGLGGRLPSRRGQVDARAPRLGEADGDRLLGGSRPVLAGADVVHLLAHELPGLGAGRLALPLVATGGSDRLLLGH